MTLQEIPNLPVPATQPIPSPTDIVDGTRTAISSGAYTVTVVFILLGIARLLYYLAEQYPTSGIVNTLRLGSSRVRAFLTGFIGLLVTTLFEIGATTGLDYTVLLGIVGATLALWLRPEPKDKPTELATVRIEKAPVAPR